LHGTSVGLFAGKFYYEGMKVQLRQISPSTSETTIRTHQIFIDRPVTKGGADRGPMGGELFLASVGGCFMSNLLAAIHSRAADISGVCTEVIGTLADAPPARFTALELCITADAGDPKQLEHLVDIADRGCIMMNTLRGRLSLVIRVGEPSLRLP
jgi:putative redox protein